jgi:hypothetical protein
MVYSASVVNGTESTKISEYFVTLAYGMIVLQNFVKTSAEM